MPAKPPTDDNESGVLVYPRLPVPTARGEGERERSRRPGGRGKLRAIGLGLGALVVAGGGAAAAWFARPSLAPDPQIAASAARAAKAEAAASTEQQRAAALQRELEVAQKAKLDADARLAVAEPARAELTTRDEVAASRRQAAQAALSRITGALDRSAGTAALDGDEIHVQLADRVLWKPGDDALSDRGKAVLGKLAAVLRELPEHKIWVQGHADEPQAPAPTAAKPPPPAKKAARPAPVPPAPPAPAVRFATSWELSAARALSVVHYLQDVARIDPGRLGALAFGHYAPVGKDRAVNRRLELVVAPPRAAHP